MVRKREQAKTEEPAPTPPPPEPGRATIRKASDAERARVRGARVVPGHAAETATEEAATTEVAAPEAADEVAPQVEEPVTEAPEPEAETEPKETGPVHIAPVEVVATHTTDVPGEVEEPPVEQAPEPEIPEPAEEPEDEEPAPTPQEIEAEEKAREKRREQERERREARAARKAKEREKREREREKDREKRRRQEQRKRNVAVGTVVKIPDPVSVRGLADALQLDTSDILRELLVRGAPSNINATIAGDTASAIAADLGIQVEIVHEEISFETAAQAVESRKRKAKGGKKEAKLKTVSRPPVVTVLGHVDHGKTLLLDSIRETSVVEGESGGITQHIGASEITHNDRPIVFLDTPGHEAFSAMRARGAQVTDIAILVVAANDGIMPQTVEAINHAKAAKVPIIVAVNKIDLPDANPERVLQQLTEYDLLPEAWGGDTVAVNVSALKKEGLEDLLEMILLVADVQELTAEVGGDVKAVVIEAERDSSRGPVATVIVREGVLKTGDSVVCGQWSGKVRALISPAGKKVKKVEPGYACEIWGLDDVPEAGEELRVVENQKVAKQIAKELQEAARKRASASAAPSSVAALMEQIQAGAVTDVNVVLKADVHGSLEAITQAMEKLEHREVKIKVAHSGVGSVSESDVNLASAARALIIAFQVGSEPGVDPLAREEKVEIREYSVIYEIIEDMKDLMVGKLKPVFKEEILGHAEVRAVFKISRTGVVAGCAVTDGQMRRGEGIRVFREDELLYEGKLNSLRHVKDDVSQVEGGRECGISLDDWNGFAEGDIIECYTMRQLQRTLAD
jgi:translation initiation factor IF-2